MNVHTRGRVEVVTIIIDIFKLCWLFPILGYQEVIPLATSTPGTIS